MYKFETHCHTTASDGRLSPAQVIEKLAEKGFDGVVITDHDTIKGLKEAKITAKEYGLIFIPGIEITTPCCDILGIGIEKAIKGNAKEVIKAIHKLGGVAILAHPCIDALSDIFRKRIGLINEFDGIEVVNAHASLEANIQALKLAEEYKKVKTAGSDAHFEEDIGIVFTSSRYKDLVRAIKERKVGIGWV